MALAGDFGDVGSSRALGSVANPNSRGAVQTEADFIELVRHDWSRIS